MKYSKLIKVREKEVFEGLDSLSFKSFVHHDDYKDLFDSLTDMLIRRKKMPKDYHIESVSYYTTFDDNPFMTAFLKKNDEGSDDNRSKWMYLTDDQMTYECHKEAEMVDEKTLTVFVDFFKTIEIEAKEKQKDNK